MSLASTRLSLTLADLPRMMPVRQAFPRSAPLQLEMTVRGEMARLAPRIKPLAKIAVGVGSRGISNLLPIVQAVLGELKRFGAEPFVIPAMGSHGGATPEGQREVLGTFGITESNLGVPIYDSLDVRHLGETSEGIPVYCSTEAMKADGILLINRIKPHTDFFGKIGSGLLKMAVIGLGKRMGASTMHLAATEFGYETAIRSMAGALIERTALIGGIAILENQYHETARLVAVDRDAMAGQEEVLLEESRSMLPLIPFPMVDLLIVDYIGKNISGTGMDPNVTQRSVHGYDSFPQRGARPNPFIRRIFVRDLTVETHGNAIGIGMADATTRRLVDALDLEKTSINSLTALTPQAAKIPIAFESDFAAIERMLISLPLRQYREAKIVRIRDTLSVADMEISESLTEEMRSYSHVISLGEAQPMRFDSALNLLN